MFTLPTFLMGSYQSLVTFLLISKGQKQAPSSPSLAKPSKPLKTKFVTKPPLKNQYRYRAHNFKMYSITLLF
jgi:hypothetical protein